jgi:hypothetical protein
MPDAHGMSRIRLTISTLFALTVFALMLAPVAVAHETESSPSAACQSGEVCLWPDYASYWQYYTYQDCQYFCTHASYSGSDAAFTGYHPWWIGNTVYLNNNTEVMKNRGNYCRVYMWTGSYFTGSYQRLDRGQFVQGSAVLYPNDTSSNHWCQSS